MNDMLLKDWAEEWLSTKRDYVKESTYANYIFLMEKHILPQFGNEPVSSLNGKRIQRSVKFWLEKGRCDGKGGLSRKTVKDMLVVFRMCLCDYGQAYECAIPSWKVEFPPENTVNRREVLSRKQQQMLVEWIKHDLNYETIGYAVTLYTGIRIGELCALKWGDVNIERKSISVTKTIQRVYLKDQMEGKGYTKVTITTPKSRKSVREIPMSESLFELIEKFGKQDPEHYLVTGTKNFMEPRLYRKHYARFLEKRKATYIHFHGLRHTFATRCVESGADYKVVSELLGHASVNLTLNLYVHPQWEDKKRCVDLV